MKHIFKGYISDILKELNKSKYTILFIVGTVTLFPIITNIYLQYSIEAPTKEVLAAAFGSWIIILITTILMLAIATLVVLLMITIIKFFSLIPGKKKKSKNEKSKKKVA